MLGLPLVVVLVFLTVAAVRWYDAPLTEALAWSALQAYEEAHPDAFDGLGVAHSGVVVDRWRMLAGDVRCGTLSIDVERRSYSYESRRRGPLADAARYTVDGRFERRWGTWVVVPERESDEPAEHP